MSEEYYWDIANATEMGRYLTRKEIGLLRFFFQDSRGIKSCLDIGCGSGRFSLPIRELGVRVTAMENDLLPLSKLQNKGREIFTILGDAICLPFKDSCFDCIVGIEVISYLPNIDTFLQECHRVLNEHGYLCLTFSNRSSYKRYLHRLRSQFRIFYRQSFAGIKAALEKQGFQLEAISGFNWLPFGRGSNSKLIRVFERLEVLLCLGRLPSISPWVFLVARKREQLE